MGGKGGWGKSGKSGKSSKGGKGKHTVVKTIVKYVTKGSGKGKGGKGKGKGKRRAAPLESKFWESKVDEEDRKTVGSKTFSGTIERYNLKFGYGFITADDPNSLPKNVKKGLS